MATFKEYRSVSEFPADAESLSHEELLNCYQELRNTYGSLTNIREQLFRGLGESQRPFPTSPHNRQQKEEPKLTTLSQKIDQTLLNLTQKYQELEQKQEELRILANALSTKRLKLNLTEADQKNMQDDINQLEAERQVILAMIADLDSTYQAVKNKEGLLGTVYRKHNLMRAIFQILTADMNELIRQQKIKIERDQDRRINSPN